MIKDQNLTDISNENISDIDNKIKKVVGNLTQGGINPENIPNLVTEHLESIKTLLMQLEHSESYQNIGPLFKDKKGFNALKEVFLFEYNGLFGITTQNNIDPANSMKTLKTLFVNSNEKASEIQQNIAEIEKSIKSTKEQSEELRKGLKESAKTVLPKLLRMLFTKILYQILKKVEDEQSHKSGKKLNNLKDQFHITINLFNKELNSLMDVYAESINHVSSKPSITSAYDEQLIDESDYATIESLNIAIPQATDNQKQQKTDSSIYATIKWVGGKKQTLHILHSQPEITYGTMKTHTAQHAEIYELPKAQISPPIAQKLSADTQKKVVPQVPPKPSQEAINKALNKTGADTQKKVAPPVPPKPRAQEVSRNVAKNINAQNIKTEVTSLRQNSIAESVKQLSTNQARPQKLNIPTGRNWASNAQHNQKLGTNIQGLINTIGNKIPMGSPTTSPKQSPTFARKNVFNAENNQVQNEAPKEIKQSIASNANGTSIPPPPPLMPKDWKTPKLASSHVDDNKVQDHEARKTKTPRSVSTAQNNMMLELKQRIIGVDKKVQTTLDSPLIKEESTRGR